MKQPKGFPAALERWFSVILPLLFLFFVIWSIPLGTAFQFGSDEGYELMKGFLVSEGHRLYSEIWNDQPPLHTGVLALVFKVFGPNLLAARVLAAAISALMLWAFYRIVELRSGHAAAWTAVILLACSLSFPRLSVSVMLEPAMMMMGLMSVLALFKYEPEKGGRSWLMLSGFLMGLALQTKLTAPIFIPAIIFELARREGVLAGLTWSAVRSRWKEFGRHFFKRPLLSLLIWMGMVLAGFALVWSIFPEQSAAMMLESHFSKGTRERFGEGFGLQSWRLFGDLELAFLGGLGVVAVLGRRRGTLLFPVVLLATVFVVHNLNRPFWPYYWLHFTAPMAWLSAIGLRELFDLFWRTELHDWKRWLIKRSWALLLWSAALSLAVTSAPLKLLDEARLMRSAPRVEENVLVRELAIWRNGADWIYTSEVIYAFHARIPVAPELAVLPRKRFASDQIDQARILQIVKRYEPEMLLLSQSGLDHEWGEYLDSNYKVSGQFGHLQLYLRRDLNAEDRQNIGLIVE
jgi:4-amino-4-deoxy-L-arabinose transferase-like glycosyltransferase